MTLLPHQYREGLGPCSKYFRRFQVYQRISKNAFGIYLFHPVLIYSLLYITQKLSINPWVLATSTFILSFILSSYLTTFFRTIKLGWAIGERKR